MPLYYSWVTLAACELCCFCEPITDFHLLPLLAIAWDFDAHTQQCSSSETSVVRTMSFCLILKMILNSSVLSDYYGFIESEISHRRRRHTNILNLVTWELTVRSRVSFFGTIHFRTWRVIVRVFFLWLSTHLSFTKIHWKKTEVVFSTCKHCNSQIEIEWNNMKTDNGEFGIVDSGLFTISLWPFDNRIVYQYKYLI